jgi:hypothetical protein
MPKPTKTVFISYAHKDEAFFTVFKEGLISHLYTSDKYDFGVWEDSQIHLGFFWDNEIQQNLGKAGVAILCVSANFLNSKYIAAKEFGVLTSKFPSTLIVPVYFNHCNINAWDELASRQFFKPAGEKYDKPGSSDFAFCDLVKFADNRQPVPNANTDKYFLDLVRKIEASLKNKDSGTDIEERTEVPVPKEDPNPGKEAKQNVPHKIVLYTIVCSIVGTALLFFYFLLFGKSVGQEMIFKSSVSGAMFFASMTAYSHNRKTNAG